jgi:hypothetical protein
MSEPKFTRPALDEALNAWQKHLADRNLPAKCLWIFAENFCVEASESSPGNYRVGFQTQFTPPSDDALDIAYDVLGESDTRLVFYRVGSSPRGSVCTLLGDSWFEGKGPNEGFLRNDKWGISFFPGEPGDIEEITDLSRWLRRLQGNRGVLDFDFAMSLATIDEIKIHGRVLLPFERYAESMLNRLRRMHGNPS